MAPTFRRGTLADSYTVYTVFVRSVEDFTRRMNVHVDDNAGDLAAWWARRQSLFEHLARTADQSAGVGRELLARDFPAEGVSHRSIIATTDSRAQGRYLRAGVYTHFPIY